MSVRSSPHGGAFRFFRAAVPWLIAISSLTPSLQPAAVQAAATATNILTLRVQTLDANTPISAYQFMINRDDSGETRDSVVDCFPDTNPDYPAGCDWASVHSISGGTQQGLVTQGNETHLNETTGINLPDGKYVISVVANGHKIDGEHFRVPLEGAGLLTIQMYAMPLPLSTIRVRVFGDTAGTNGELDIPGEQGLPGFRALVEDVGGEVTTDWFGNPLCTQYGLDGLGNIDPEQPIPGTGGVCLSDANGDLVVPHLGPGRYEVSAIPPNGQTWYRTTTLEGGPGWDVWPQENNSGYETEVILGGEAIPEIPMGFVKPTACATNALAPVSCPAATGGITGTVWSVKTYFPPVGGLFFGGNGGSSTSGTALDKRVANPLVALGALQGGDQTVWMGRGTANGTFTIQNVPNGNYVLTVWDINQLQLLDFKQVTVANGQVTNAGDIMVAHWFGIIEGYIFVDTNENGIKDTGEFGIPNFELTLRKRDNALVDQFDRLAITNNSGYYIFRRVYPYLQWTVLEAYNDRYFTTGYTFKTDNQPTSTTVLGAGVDVSMFVGFGLTTRMDWGVKPYAPGTNGGIPGTVSYEVTRNELDPRLAAIEDYQPGIPDLEMRLYAAKKDANGAFEFEADGSFKKGPLLNTTTTETWQRPKDCVARKVDGSAFTTPFMPLHTTAGGGGDCLESATYSNQVDTDFAAVNGNWGFGDILNDPVTGAPLPEPLAIPNGDYLVEVVIPNDAYGRPMYQVTREEDVNVFDGDQYVPQVPPPACAGALHVVDVAGVGADGPNAVNNPTFAENGGSPYEGQSQPLCNVKLATVQSQRSVAPAFTLWTPVPLPMRFYGLIVDDLHLSLNPRETLYGDKVGVPNAPIGIYDWNGRLVETIESDPNGWWEVILPSTTTTSCPTPAGVCANVYRFVANDPGTPDKPNSNYNPQFRTISANFQAWPGQTLPADLAPTQIRASITGGASGLIHPPACLIDTGRPELYSVNQPYVNGSGTITIKGLSFGPTQGTGSVKLGNTTVTVSSWSDRQIVVSVPGSITPGAYQLKITGNNGLSTQNALTFHVRGAGYNPTLFEVGPGKTYATVQAALNAARPVAQALVVVYPNTPGTYNPKGYYYENIVIASPVKLQGVGPGGVYPENTAVQGSGLDGLGFVTQQGRVQAWRALVNSLTWSGNQNVYEGQVVYVVATDSQFTAAYPASIDGFTVQGGDQLEFPGTITQIGGVPIPNPVLPGIVQGGGIFVNAFARNLLISNNVLQSNGGTYGGAIRVGTPQIGDNQNDNIKVLNNRVIANGGTVLAGAIGLFAGAEGYEIANNDMCGNYSTEYGGGISHYGYSPFGKIHDNRIYFNESYDEGGGMFVGGELPTNPNVLSQGSGPVDIYSNIIQSNLANDDGAGVRLLSTNSFLVNIFNNFIVNNIGTHEGGGVALDDAANVKFFNNTVMKNLTTATAFTSDGTAAPAGLSDTGNSSMLQSTLPSGSANFSNPLLFNNIFYDNRAGTWNGSAVTGIGLAGDPFPINVWDMGVVGGGLLAPTNSIVNSTAGFTPSPTNQVNVNPNINLPYDTSVIASPWRGDPNFVNTVIVAVDVPAALMGDYHLKDATSPANNTGAANKATVNAPSVDIDGNGRPSGAGYEIGGDELPGGTAVVAFPQNTTPLDTFGRLLINVPIFGPNNWRGNTVGNFAISCQTLLNCGTTGQLRVFTTGYVFWNPTSFNTNQEAYFTFKNVSQNAPRQSLLLKVNNLSASPSASNPIAGIGATTRFIEVRYNQTTQQVSVETVAPGQGRIVRGVVATGVTFNGGTGTFNNTGGDVFGARALSDGTVKVYKNGGLLGQLNVATGPNPFPAGGGRIGVWFEGPNFNNTTANRARFDNFGGGNLTGPGPFAANSVADGNAPTAETEAAFVDTPLTEDAWKEMMSQIEPASPNIDELEVRQLYMPIVSR